MKYQRILSRALVSFVLTLTMVEFSTAQVERIWLTHPSSKPDKLSINWESVTPGNAVVRYGASEQYDSMITVEENTRLHPVKKLIELLLRATNTPFGLPRRYFFNP